MMEEESKKRQAVLTVKILASGGRGGTSAMTEEEPVDEPESSDDADKKDQEDVNYMTSPARCRDCEYFMAPSSCQKVSGEIFKNGFCHLFEISSGEDDAE